MGNNNQQLSLAKRSSSLESNYSPVGNNGQQYVLSKRFPVRGSNHSPVRNNDQQHLISEQSAISESNHSPVINKDDESGLAKRHQHRLCNFCRLNDEDVGFYESHQLKDEFGNVTCPILSSYVCDVCGATGPKAHTISYCPVLRANCKNPPKSSICLKRTKYNSSGRPRRVQAPKDWY